MKQHIFEDSGYNLIMDDADIEYIREKTKDYIKTINTGRAENWWTTLHTLEDGSKVYPFESVEKDMFDYYFIDYCYNNTFEPGIARIAIDELKFDLSMDHAIEFVWLKKTLDLIMTSEGEYSKYDENLNGLSFDELYKRYENSLAIDYAKMEKRIWDKTYTKNP